MSDITLKELFQGKIGGQYRGNSWGILEKQESVLNDLVLCDMEKTEKGYRGNLNLDGEAFQGYPLFQGKYPVSFDKGEDQEFQGTLSLPAEKIKLDVSPLKGRVGDAYLLFSNTRFTDKTEYTSSMYFAVKLDFVENKDADGEEIGLVLKYPLFCEGSIIDLQGTFYDSKGSEGITVTDGIKNLTSMLGVEIDFASCLPAGLDFTDKIKLFEFSFSIEAGEWQKYLNKEKNNLKVVGFSVTAGFSGDIFNGGIPGLAICDPRVLFSWKREGINSMLSGRLVLGKTEKPVISMNVMVSLPGLHLDICQQADALITDITDYYLGYPLPKAFAGMKVSQISVVVNPEEKEFYFGVLLSDLIEVSINQRAEFALEDIGVDFFYEENRLNASLAALLALKKTSGEEILEFSLEAGFREGEVTCRAGFTNQYSEWYGYDYEGENAISISDITEALFNVRVPEDFPEIFLTKAELSFALTGGTAGNLEGSFGVKVSNWQVFGKTFDLEAELFGSGNELHLYAALTLDDMLKIGVDYAASGGTANLKGTLEFDGFGIEVAYKEDKEKIITGRIAKRGYTLGMAASYLTHLINPDSNMTKSGDWGFLNDISLEGVEISYNITKKSLAIWVNVNTNLSFAKLEKAGVCMKSSGVSFQVAGTFLGERYTEDNPLSWDTTGTPPSTGSPLHVEYLALGEHIDISTRERSVEKNLICIENQINKEKSPDKISAKAGKVMGLSCQIADTVDLLLVYNQSNSLCGAKFGLYGSRAGKLKGLEAEIMYTKVNDTTGVFSGRIVPSASLRNIDFGGIAIGIGNIAVSVYTNGDFSIDLGFPHNRNFSMSFSLKYGIFYGSGGIYLSKDTLQSSRQVPVSSKGYFSPVLSCGIGLRMGLSKSFSIGILSAGVSLTMTGIFQGVYATFVPYKGGEGQTYYRVEADVEVYGCLNGNVNFGIIGAGVSLQIRAGARLRLESSKAAVLHLSLYVHASAYVKVLWWRISFGFSLNFSLDFELGRNETPVWAVQGYNRQRERLFFTGGEVTEIPIWLVPVYTAPFVGESYPLVLFAGMSRENFKVFVEILAQMAEENGGLSGTHGMELFAMEKFFSGPDEIEEFLGSRIRFVLTEPSQEEKEKETVVMPMPVYVTEEFHQVISGQEHLDRVNLEETEKLDTAYFFTLNEYYRDMEEKSQLMDGLKENEPRTISEYIFEEYFELVLKAVRAQKQETESAGCDFHSYDITEEELENIMGMTQRFLLGGKRVPKEAGAMEVTGAYEKAGCQFEIRDLNNLEEISFVLKRNEDAPDWFVFYQGEETFTSSITLSDIREYLPDKWELGFPQGEPELIDYYGKVEEVSVYLARMAEFSQGISCYKCNIAGQEGREFSYQGDKGGMMFLMSLNVLLSYNEEGAIRYTIEGYGETEELFSLLEDLSREDTALSIESAELYFKDSLNSGSYEKWQGDIWIAKNSLSTQDKPVTLINEDAGEEEFYAYLSREPMLFLRLLAESLRVDGNYILGGAVFLPGGADITQLVLAIRFPQQEKGVCRRWLNGIWQQGDKGQELEIRLKQETWLEKVGQGRRGLYASLACKDAMNALSLAFIIEDEEGNAISGESIPAFAKSQDENMWYRLTVPYYRFLGEDKTDVYAGISGKKTCRVSLFATDVLGNKSDVFGTYSITPKYTDVLKTPTQYSGLKVTYFLKEEGEQVKIVLYVLFDPDNYEKEDFAYEIHQLKQPDVKMYFSTPLMDNGEEWEYDKREFVEFLEKCLDARSKERISWTMELGVCTMEENMLEEVSLKLRLSRDKDLCMEGLPEEVREAVTELSIYEPQTNEDVYEDGISWSMLDTAEKYAIFKWGGEYRVLGYNREPADFDVMKTWAYTGFPFYTGMVSDTDAKISVSSLDVEQIWEKFREDIRTLEKNGEPELLKRTGNLRRYMAEVISGLVAPVYGEEEKKEAVSGYLKELLLSDFQISLKNLMFLCGGCKSQEIKAGEEESVTAYGDISQVQSYPAMFSCDGKEGTVTVAYVWDGEKEKESLDYQIQFMGVRSKIFVKWFTSNDPARFSIPVTVENDLNFPGRERPEAPVVMSQQYLEEGVMSVSVRLNLQIKDVLYFALDEDNEKEVKAAGGISEIYEYDIHRAQYLESQDTEGLLALMEGCAHGFLAYAKEPAGLNEPLEFSLTAKGSDSIEGFALNCIREDFRILGMVRHSDEVELTRENEVYRFPEALRPMEGESFLLKIQMPAKKVLGCSFYVQRGDETMHSAFMLQSDVVRGGSI